MAEMKTVVEEMNHMENTYGEDSVTLFNNIIRANPNKVDTNWMDVSYIALLGKVLNQQQRETLIKILRDEELSRTTTRFKGTGGYLFDYLTKKNSLLYDENSYILVYETIRLESYNPLLKRQSPLMSQVVRMVSGINNVDSNIGHKVLDYILSDSIYSEEDCKYIKSKLMEISLKKKAEEYADE